MGTTGADPIFVDTNVLVYATQASAPWHADATSALANLRSQGSPLWISRQILREYLATLSRPQTFSAPLPMSVLVADIRHFEAMFSVAEDGPQVTAHLLNLLSTISCAGKQIHDANIVATMLAHGLPKLLTHNVSDFARFAGQIQVVPLV